MGSRSSRRYGGGAIEDSLERSRAGQQCTATARIRTGERQVAAEDQYGADLTGKASIIYFSFVREQRGNDWCSIADDAKLPATFG